MARRREGQRSGDHGRRSHSPVGERPLFHFFKIILPSTLEEKKLRIPYKFFRKFGNELSDVANLIVPNGRAWKVGLSKAENAIWFDDGWQNFLKHHSICNAYFLMFGYRGLCNFSVLIFDATASEIEYPCNDEGPSCGEKSLIQVQCQDDSPVEILTSTISSPSCCSLKRKISDASATKRYSGKRHNSSEQNLGMLMRSRGPNRRNKKLKVEELAEIIDLEDNESRRGKQCIHQKHSKSKCSSGKTELLFESEDEEVEVITSEMLEYIKAPRESESAILAARKYKSKTPACAVLLRAYSCHGNRLYLPRQLGRQLSGTYTCIKLQVSEGKEWEVHLCRKGYKRVEIVDGWNSFRNDNNLDVGDVCVFELVKDQVLKVLIFRAVRDANTKVDC